MNKGMRGITTSNINKPNKLSNKTFPEVVSLSKTKKECIRNIKIVAQDPDDAARASKHLANNYACQDIAITSISNKTDNFITVKCASLW